METLCDAKLNLSIHPDIFYKDIFWDKYFFDENTIKALLKISNYKPLKEYNFKILGAATVNEAYLIKEHIRELNNSVKDYFKLINTGTIDPFVNYWGIKKTKYIKGSYEQPIIAKSNLNKISNRLIFLLE